MNGLWVVLSNSGGELDRKFAENEEQAADAARLLIQTVPYLAPGDKITVEEGWSEQ